MSNDENERLPDGLLKDPEFAGYLREFNAGGQTFAQRQLLFRMIRRRRERFLKMMLKPTTCAYGPCHNLLHPLRPYGRKCCCWEHTRLKRQEATRAQRARKPSTW